MLLFNAAAAMLPQTPLTGGLVEGFSPPCHAQWDAVSRQLSKIREWSSPVYFSTQASGRRLRGLAGLPPLTGPIIFIGNHQLYGYLDQPILVEELYRETGVLLRSLAHRDCFRDAPAEPPMLDTQVDVHRQKEMADSVAENGSEGAEQSGGWLLSFDFARFGCVPASARALYRLLALDEKVLLYPGGLTEGFAKKRGYELIGWPDGPLSADFARIAARHNATIIPIAAVGADEGFLVLLDSAQLRRLVPFLPGGNEPPEGPIAPLSIPLPPERYYFCFGKPISSMDTDPSDRSACASLYRACRRELTESISYLENTRSNDRYRAFGPRWLRATWRRLRGLQSTQAPLGF